MLTDGLTDGEIEGLTLGLFDGDADGTLGIYPTYAANHNIQISGEPSVVAAPICIVPKHDGLGIVPVTSHGLPLDGSVSEIKFIPNAVPTLGFVLTVLLPASTDNDDVVVPPAYDLILSV